MMKEMNDLCRFTENADLYGIGIRVGVYAQWVAALLANIWVRDEVDNIQWTAMCFQTGILASLVALTSSGDIDVPEVLVVLPLCFGGFMVSSAFDADLARHREQPASPMRMLVSGLIFCAFTSYSTWFWTHGVLKISPPSCHYPTLLFVPVTIDRLRVFGIVVSIIGDTVLLCMTTFALFRLHSLCRHHGGSKTSVFNQFIEPRLFTDPPERSQMSNIIRAGIALLVLTHILVMIELTLHWNPREQMGRASSAGQLIPMIVGLLALVRVLFCWLWR